MEEIIEMYKAGASYKEIAKGCNCSEYKVWTTVKKSGSGNSKPEKPNPLRTFSPEALYWLGYIIADGTIQYNKRHATLVLFSTHKEILEKFNEFMCGNCKIQIWVNNVYGARIHSKSICEWLINECDITPNKALTVNPNIDIDWDLLRGYFDGDGSVRLTGYHAESKFTTGSFIWANRISELLFENDIYNVITQKGNAYDVNIYRKSESEKLFRNLYKDATVYLEYKYNRFVALFGNE